MAKLVKRAGECDHCHNYTGDLIPICDFNSSFLDVIDSCCPACYDLIKDINKEAEKEY